MTALCNPSRFDYTCMHCVITTFSKFALVFEKQQLVDKFYSFYCFSVWFNTYKNYLKLSN